MFRGATKFSGLSSNNEVHVYGAINNVEIMHDSSVHVYRTSNSLSINPSCIMDDHAMMNYSNVILSVSGCMLNKHMRDFIIYAEMIDFTAIYNLFSEIKMDLQ
jgi:hypothetical protein